MKKILSVLLCLGMLFGCSSKVTKEDVQNKCEEILDILRDGNIGEFTLLTTNYNEGKDGAYYYDCNVKYTTKDDNDIDLTITIDKNGLSMFHLSDKEIFTYPKVFQEYYIFYETIIKNDVYFKIDKVTSSKLVSYADFLNDELENLKDNNVFSLENGNLTLNFSYSRLSSDDVWMDIIFTGKRSF